MFLDPRCLCTGQVRFCFGWLSSTSPPLSQGGRSSNCHGHGRSEQPAATGCGAAAAEAASGSTTAEIDKAVPSVSPLDLGLGRGLLLGIVFVVVVLARQVVHGAGGSTLTGLRVERFSLLEALLYDIWVGQRERDGEGRETQK